MNWQLPHKDPTIAAMLKAEERARHEPPPVPRPSGMALFVLAVAAWSLAGGVLWVWYLVVEN
jgi:hypothetical protein